MAPTVLRLRRRSGAFQVSILLAAVVAAALGHVHLHLQLLQVGYHLSAETRLRHDLGEQKQKLRLEAATRRDPAVIERRAREELGMAPPRPDAIRILRAAPALTGGFVSREVR